MGRILLTCSYVPDRSFRSGNTSGLPLKRLGLLGERVKNLLRGRLHNLNKFWLDWPEAIAFRLLSFLESSNLVASRILRAFPAYMKHNLGEGIEPCNHAD